MDAGDVHAARLQLDHEEDEVPLEAGQREYVDGEEVGVRQPKGSATTLLPEDAVLLPEIVGQIFLVAVDPASDGEHEESQGIRHDRRLLENRRQAGFASAIRYPRPLFRTIRE